MVNKYAIIRRPVEGRILFIRKRKVLLDSDLADLYRVTVKRLNEQIKRNADRFPVDFMFRLTPEENRVLRSQIATSNGGRGGRRYPPFVFTEHGAIMAAAVLNSPRAVEMSVFVVRAFVRLNDMLASNRELAGKVMELDRRLKTPRRSHQSHCRRHQTADEAVSETHSPDRLSNRSAGEVV